MKMGQINEDGFALRFSMNKRKITFFIFHHYPSFLSVLRTQHAERYIEDFAFHENGSILFGNEEFFIFYNWLARLGLLKLSISSNSLPLATLWILKWPLVHEIPDHQSLVTVRDGDIWETALVEGSLIIGHFFKEPIETLTLLFLFVSWLLIRKVINHHTVSSWCTEPTNPCTDIWLLE